jgi:hypothetical protein
MTVTMAFASINACAAPNPILKFRQHHRHTLKTMELTDPEVPPTTIIFLPISLSADLTIL